MTKSLVIMESMLFWATVVVLFWFVMQMAVWLLSELLMPWKLNEDQQDEQNLQGRELDSFLAEELSRGSTLSTADVHPVDARFRLDQELFNQ
jgi:hypothetical protein